MQKSDIFIYKISKTGKYMKKGLFMSEKQDTKEKGSRIDGYLRDKFGMFIHWGAYTVAGAEASWPIMAPRLSEAMFDTPSEVTEEEYVKLPERFNPQKFDADAWAACAKDAGMRYMVITAKHHDGFCMFDAPGTDYKITNTEFGRDVCLELAEACKKHGIKLGFYYSPPDMHHPDYRDTKKPAVKNWLGEPERPEWGSYLDYMESHIRKLLTDYGDVYVIWFDGLCNHQKYDPERFHKLIHELSPDTLINDRLGDGYDFVTPEQFIPKDGIPVKTGKPPSSDGIESEKFFRTVITLFKLPVLRGWIRAQMRKYSDGTLELTPVRQEPYPSPECFQPWETCMTIGQSWAYNPDETKWKGAKELIENLCRVASGGGNYLLNVGPTDTGEFPEQAAGALKKIGGWMRKNSEAIYGSTYTPIKKAAWGCATRKGGNIYLCVFESPKDGKLTVEGFPADAKKAFDMTGGEVMFEQNGANLALTLPANPDAPLAQVIRVETDERSEGLLNYNEPITVGKPQKKYIIDAMKASAIINGMANGLIALFSYLKPSHIAAAGAGVDALITVAIISFFTSLLVVGSTRKDIKNEKLAVEKAGGQAKKPMLSGFKALIIMALTIILLGGALNGIIFAFIPNGFSNWAYIIFKTAYTALTGALAVWFSIRGVLLERR